MLQKNLKIKNIANCFITKLQKYSTRIKDSQLAVSLKVSNFVIMAWACFHKETLRESTSQGYFITGVMIAGQERI